MRGSRWGGARWVRVRVRVRIRVSVSVRGAHDGVARVDLHGLLGDEVLALRAVTKGLSLHDALHVGAVSVLARHDDGRGAVDPVRDSAVGVARVRGSWCLNACE